MPFEVTKKGAGIMSVAPPLATCSVGAAFPGDSPWGYYWTDDGGTVFGGVQQGWQRIGYGDRLLQKGAGMPHRCATKGIVESWNQEGYGIPSKYWSDELTRSVKGVESLQFYQERRVRALLNYLADPQAGFSTGVAASAYDASFCSPTTPTFGFTAACIKARSVFNQIFGQSRWTYMKHQIKYECEEEYRWTGRWVQSSPPAFSPQTGCAVSLIRDVGRVKSLSDHPFVGGQTIDESWIPLRDVLYVSQAGDKRTLMPSSWLRALLDCLVPGWNKATVSKQGSLMKVKPTAKRTAIKAAPSMLFLAMSRK